MRTSITPDSPKAVFDELLDEMRIAMARRKRAMHLPLHAGLRTEDPVRRQRAYELSVKMLAQIDQRIQQIAIAIASVDHTQL